MVCSAIYAPGETITFKYGGFSIMAKVIQRGKSIQTRVTDEEYAYVENKAESLGLSITNYLRFVALHAKIEVTVSINSDKE